MEIKNVIKELRTNAGLTQAELAKSLGLSLVAIKSYESGRREPNSKVLVLLENFFNVSGAYLRGEIENKEPMMKHEDPEIMNEIDDMLVPLMNNILKLAKDEPEENRELLFNIWVEIKSILKISDPNNKTMILDLVAGSIHNLNSNVNRYSESRKNGGTKKRILNK